MRAAALVAVLTVACAACGGSSAAGRITEAKPPVAKRLLTARLRSHYLRFHWVACVRTGRDFRNVPVVRCNVNFGDPHIEAYCSVLQDGRLLTDHDDPGIPCKHDDAGPGPTLVHS